MPNAIPFNISDTTQLYKMYKPFGVLSQLSSNDERQIRTKRFISDLFEFPEGTMPIGRLDEKSEGLLLFTNDGKLSDYINRGGIQKEYYAQLDGDIDEEAIELLKKGVEIGLGGTKYRTKVSYVKRLLSEPKLEAPDPKLRLGRHRANSWISICLDEGKFRQIRKMTAAVGYPTIRLIRVRIGEIRLANLLPGEVNKINVPSQ
jgi:23S rRNA pseudouridine2457 synthase